MTTLTHGKSKKHKVSSTGAKRLHVDPLVLEPLVVQGKGQADAGPLDVYVLRQIHIAGVRLVERLTAAAVKTRDALVVGCGSCRFVGTVGGGAASGAIAVGVSSSASLALFEDALPLASATDR